MLLDAAERSFVKHGYRGSTMEGIASEAGYTRTIIYRHFATRADLDEALMKRVTIRQLQELVIRLGANLDLQTLITECLVMVATELADDPLFSIFTEQTENGNVAQLLSNITPYTDFVESGIAGLANAPGQALRRDLPPRDAAHFLMMSALTLLVGLVPGSKDADKVRRYVHTFVLPALFAKPPPISIPVFPR